MKTLPVLLAAVALGIATPEVAENYYYDGPTGNEGATEPGLKDGRCYVEYHGTFYLDGSCSVGWGEAGFTVGKPGEPMAEVRINWQQSNVSWGTPEPPSFRQRNDLGG